MRSRCAFICEDATGNKTYREITHVKPLKQSYDMCCLFSLCHPFTAVVSGKDVMDDTFDRQLKGED